jgi:hypothetical protein
MKDKVKLNKYFDLNLEWNEKLKNITTKKSHARVFEGQETIKAIFQ